MAEWLTDGYRWQRAKFMPVRLQDMSRTPSALQVRDLASPVWRAEFLTDAMPLRIAEEYEAILESLGGARETLLVHTAQRCRPVAIPTGGLAGVTVRSIGANNDHIGLAGLPVGARISIGDFMAILTQSGSRELVKARGTGAADTAGDTPLIKLTTHLRESVAVGDPVQLVKPRMEARIEPDSLDLSQVGGRSYAVSFTALQVI